MVSSLIVDPDPDSEDFDTSGRLMLHRIREAWRGVLFQRWKVRSGRCEALCAPRVQLTTLFSDAQTDRNRQA